MRSVRPWLLKNHAKSAKNKIFDPKISPNNFFRRRNMKRWESPETRFGKVSSRSEPYLRGKRPIKVCRSLYHLGVRRVLCIKITLPIRKSAISAYATKESEVPPVKITTPTSRLPLDIQKTPQNAPKHPKTSESSETSENVRNFQVRDTRRQF